MCLPIDIDYGINCSQLKSLEIGKNEFQRLSLHSTTNKVKPDLKQKMFGAIIFHSIYWNPK